MTRQLPAGRCKDLLARPLVERGCLIVPLLDELDTEQPSSQPDVGRSAMTQPSRLCVCVKYNFASHAALFNPFVCFSHFAKRHY